MAKHNPKNTISGKSTKPAYENFVLGVIYRHPAENYSAFSESLGKSLHILNRDKSNYVIVGDVNVDTEKYNIASYATDYLNCINSYGCNMFINHPTRVTANGASCLDHVYSNLPTSDLNNYILLSDVSDHFATLTKAKGIKRPQKHESIYRRKSNLTEQQWAKFNEELNKTLNQKLNMTEDELDPNFVADCITNTYQVLLNKYMPLKKLSRKQKRYHNKPWITSVN